MLVVSYASSLRAYLEQRQQIAELERSRSPQSQASRSTTSSARSERWDDPAYVEQQARERLGFVMPGEIGYSVLDDDGKPLDHVDTLADPTVGHRRRAARSGGDDGVGQRRGWPATRRTRSDESRRPTRSSRRQRTRERRSTRTTRPVIASPARPAAPRGPRASAHRCPCGNPDVVDTEPRLPDGTPFPTMFYLTCPRAASLSARSRRGLMREMTDRLAADAELAAAYRRAHEHYLAGREAIGHVPRSTGISAGGMPDRVKCLHVLAGHALAPGPGVNPLGDEALDAARRVLGGRARASRR